MFNLALMQFLRTHRKKLIGAAIALTVAVVGAILEKCS